MMSKQEAINNMALFANLKEAENVQEERRLEAKAKALSERSKALDVQYQAVQDLWSCVPVHVANGTERLDNIAGQYGLIVSSLLEINPKLTGRDHGYILKGGSTLRLPVASLRHYNEIIDKANRQAHLLVEAAKGQAWNRIESADKLACGMMTEAKEQAQNITDYAQLNQRKKWTEGREALETLGHIAAILHKPLSEWQHHTPAALEILFAKHAPRARAVDPVMSAAYGSMARARGVAYGSMTPSRIKPVPSSALGKMSSVFVPAEYETAFNALMFAFDQLINQAKPN